MQKLPKNSAVRTGKIKGSAVKEGIWCKNHMPARRCDRRGDAQCAFNFLGRAGHIAANAAEVLAIEIRPETGLGPLNPVRIRAKTVRNPRGLTAPRERRGMVVKLQEPLNRLRRGIGARHDLA